ncbi:MAG: hypothetical protein HQL84_01275 [Magnetococcales bacterium]|nr:hypothetical protein [Magnetococcales bacterium]MBF0148659.1 hypothetical protein [Magnetococcales bacterium]
MNVDKIENSDVILQGGDHAITIKIQRNKISDFFNSLLSQPQTIERDFRRIFHWNKDTILDLHALIVTTVKQLNGGELSSFQADIVQSEGFSRIFHTFDDFRYTEETKDFVTEICYLEWAFLVPSNSESIKKQEIFIKIDPKTPIKISFFQYMRHSQEDSISPGNIFLQINHSSRVWADAIESIVSNFVNRKSRDPSKLKKVIISNWETITLWLVTCSLVTVFFMFLSVLSAPQKSYERIKHDFRFYDSSIETKADLDLISQKIDGLFEAFLTGQKAGVDLMESLVLLFFPLALLSAMPFFIRLTCSEPPSFIEMNPKDKIMIENIMKQYNNMSRLKILIITMLFIPIAVNLFSSYVYDLGLKDLFFNANF